MESLKELEEGKNPGPMIEIQFWNIRHTNLESLHEQLCMKTTKSMVNILKLTKSGYYSMFRYQGVGMMQLKFIITFLFQKFVQTSSVKVE